MATAAPLPQGEFTTSPSDTSVSHASPNGHLRPESLSPPSQQSQSKQAPAAHVTAGLNPRSCVTCRKRKVKCDKKQPCSNCSKAAIDCIFPGPGRAPRKSRKPQDAELLARLRRLEGVVQTLGKVGDDGADHSPNSPANNKPQATHHGDKTPTDNADGSNGGLIGAFDPKPAGQGGENTDNMVKEFGRLVVEEGRSRYVSNRLWSSLSEEVAEMRDILDDPTDDEEDFPSPGGSSSSASTNHQGFLFNFSSTAMSLRDFHPPISQIPSYWNIYKSNVDPVLKLLHVPSMEQTILKAAQDMDHISKGFEALMFTIYFAAITTLSPNECSAVLGVDKRSALQRYRFATEQAFARCSFLSTSELIVLQALLLFLVCVRRTDDSRYVWTMTGLLIRLAQALGVHRDGVIFGLTPFETELRRRLWWQIVILDVRASEDHGCDPSIQEQSFDTKFPLNINDAEIDSSMKETPDEHEGATEMTFDLIRYSVSTTVRRLSYAPPGPGPCRIKAAKLNLEDKEKMIEDLHQHLNEKYLRHCDTKNEPLHWVAATVARLIMAKMWLVVHHPLQRSDAGAGLPSETRDRLFHTSLEIIGFSRLLETEKSTLKWGWLFRTYVQWHALAFVLSQLCTRTLGPDVDRAWLIIDNVFEDWTGGVVSSTQRGMLWKPLRKLMAKARASRASALQQRAMFPLDGSIGPTTSLPATVGPLPLNTDTNGVQESLRPIGTSMMQKDGADGAGDLPNGFHNLGPILDDQQFQSPQQDLSQVMPDIDDWDPDPTFFPQGLPMMLDDNNVDFLDDVTQRLDATISPTDTLNMGNNPFSQGVSNWF